MAKPFKSEIIHAKDFTAPDRPVSTKTGPVERKTDHKPLKPALCHYRSNMRVMVLNGHPWEILSFQRPLGVKVVGMQVVNNESRFDLQDPFQVGD